MNFVQSNLHSTLCLRRQIILFAFTLIIIIDCLYYFLKYEENSYATTFYGNPRQIILPFFRFFKLSVFFGAAVGNSQFIFAKEV